MKTGIGRKIRLHFQFGVGSTALAVCLAAGPAQAQQVEVGSPGCPLSGNEVQCSGDFADGLLIELETGDSQTRFDFPNDITATNSGANAISVQDGLGDFTVVIEPDSTVTSGGGSGVGIAIESTADDSGMQTQIHEITAIVTVQKARIADRAMNAVTTYVQSSVEPGSGPLYEDSDFDNYHVVVRGAVESAGGGAIQSDSNLRVLVLGDEVADAVIATTSDNAPGVVATGAAWFAADFADLSSTGDDSPLFAIRSLDGETGTAVNVVLVDTHASTSGANSDAFALGSGDSNSVANIEINYVASVDPTTIATSGDGSRAISFDADGLSTVTGDIDDAAISTTGQNATAIAFRPGAQSSASLALEDSSVSTTGDNSHAIQIFAGANSDQLLLLERVTLTSTGENSRLLDMETAAVDNSIAAVVIIDGTLESSGDGAAGIVLGGANGNSTQTVFIADTSITTGGDDAHALDFGTTGDTSSATLNIFDSSFATSGAGSAAFTWELFGDGSAAEATIVGSSFSTTGNGSAAFRMGGTMDTDSAYSIELDTLELSTEGANSDALFIGGGGYDSTLFGFGIADTTVTTAGDNSRGAVIGQFIAGDGSSTVGSIANLTVETEGANAHGLWLGTSADGTMVDSSTAFNGANIDITTTGDGARGFYLGGLSGGMTSDEFDAELTFSLSDSTISTSGDAAIGVELFGVEGDSTGDGTSADFTLDGVTIETEGEGSAGLIFGDFANGATGTFNFTDVTISTAGPNARGLYVSEMGDFSASSVVADGLSVTTTGANASPAMFVGGIGNNASQFIDFDNLTLSTVGSNSDALFLRGLGVDNSSLAFNLTDADISTVGANSAGLYLENVFAGESGAVAADFSGVTIDTQGANSQGLYLGSSGDGANADGSLKIDIEELAITTQGDGADGLVFAGLPGGMTSTSPGDFTSELTIAMSESSIATSGDGAAAMEIGTVDGMTSSTLVAVFEHLDLSTEGDDAFGWLLGGYTGTLVDSAATLAVWDVGIDTLGDNAFGMRIGTPGATTLVDSSTVLAMEAMAITTGGDNAPGLYANLYSGGLTRSDVLVSLLDSTIATTGDNSIGFELAGVDGDITQSVLNVVLSRLDVTTTGENSHGVVIGGFPGTLTNSAVAHFLGVMTIETSGADAHGLVLGSLDLSQPRYEVVEGGYENDIATFAFQIAEVTASTTGEDADALVIGRDFVLVAPGEAGQYGIANFDGFSSANGRAVSVLGTLYTGDGQVITPGEGLVGNFSVAGLVEGDGDVAIRYDADAAIDDFFELQPGGEVNGDVIAGLGTDTFLLGGTGSDSFDVSLIGTQYLGFDALEKEDSSAWTITGTNDFAGDFLVSEGALFANATMENTHFTVSPGALLGGTGSLGAVTVNGGTFAPGNSIGTVTVNGDFTLDAASTLQIEVNGSGSNDLVIVNGMVTLGGATLDVIEGGSFAGDDPFNYIIIDNDAADAVNGTFGAIANDLAFLTPTVDYAAGDGNDVQLTLTPNGSSPSDPLFPTAATTYNQIGSAMRLEALDRSDADADAVYMSLLFSTVPQALAAFDSASGEIYASLLAVAGADGMARARRLATRGHEAFADGWGLWGGVTGSTGSIDGDGNAADADHDGYGFDVGLDYRGRGNGWAIGGTVGYLDGGLDVDDRLSHAEYDGWHLGAYGRYGTGGAGITIIGAVSYASATADVTRAIVINSLDRTARASVDIETFALSGEARYGLAMGNGWSAGPMASIHHAESDLGRVAETGADALDLSADGADDGQTRFGGGLFANWQGSGGGIDVSAQYVDGHDNVAEVPLTLRGAPGATFPVRSPRTGGAAALTTLSGHHALGGGWSIGGEARALFGGDETSIAGNVTLGWVF